MTFSVPARAAQAVRPSASTGLLATSAVVATAFTATPFAIDAVTQRYGVSAGSAALISTAQVGGFTVANLVGARWAAPTRQLALACTVALLVANALSAATPWFAGLVAARAAAGVVMGLLTWIAWADSASCGRRRGEVAAIGPLAAAVTAPLLAVVTDLGGAAGLYGSLAALGALSLVPPMAVEGERDAPRLAPRRRRRSVGANLVLASLGAFTMGGSAVFIYATVIGRERVGLTAFAVSLAFSLNAVAGIPAARFAGRRRLPGLWMAITAACALLVAITDQPWVFFAAMAIWGLAFWAAVPEAFSLLAERSATPDERVGDAQAVMSIGRVIGPTAGGALLAAGSFTALGLVGAGAMLAAAIALELVATAHRWWTDEPALAT